MERWDADLAAQLAQRESCTHMAGATPFLAQLLAASQRLGTRLPALKVFICGGASVSPALIRQASEHFERAAVTRVYGSTEVPIITVGSPDRADVRHAAETDGRPGIATLKLVGPSGRTAPQGEIWARGPQMLVGYLRPDGQERLFDADGFFRTGDLGRWQDSDYLVVSGRLKDIIIRNGENIAPKEVEDLLSEHPAIAEVTIVGLPHPLTGERACAVIVPRNAAPPDVAALGAYLKSRGLAAFKIPEQVAVWNSLPKNAAGKILKHRVQAQLMEQATRTDLA
jgi:acyl-CoA synthetase (AMP-forming)/AMP-acid ligase II